MITKNYIKMCEKAEEIQKSCEYKKGDWFYNGEKPVLFCKAGLGSFNPYEHIWLPTQEQLQEMILNNPNADFQPLWLLNKFKIFTDTINIGSLGTGIEDSFNELWLSFVMKEKYNKIWNGKDWEKWKE